MAKFNPGFNDLKLAAEVRSLTLQEMKKILLQDEMDEFKKQLILRLAANTLPRLNEHTGKDGDPISLKQVTGMKISKDAD